MAGTNYRYRPRDIRRLIESVEVVSLASGEMRVVPKWIEPAGGYFTRTRIAIWICDTLNDKLAHRRVAQATAPERRDVE